MTTNMRIASVVLMTLLAGSGASLRAQPADPAHDHGAAGGVPAGPVQPIPLPPKSPFDFDTVIHDWGKIGDDKAVTFDFTFKNKSAKTVKILDVKASCGCTGVTADRTIEPGANGKITVTFNPAGRNGREIKTVNVTLDDPDCPLIQLTTVAEVLKRIIIEPGSVGFGEVPYGRGGAQEFTIAGRADGFAVTAAQLGPGTPFRLEPVGQDTVESSGQKLPRVRYRVTMDPSAAIGMHSGAITASTTDPSMPSINVSIFAVVVGNVRVSPDRFPVRMTGQIEPFVSEVMLSSPTGKPFDILGVSVEANDVLRAVADLIPVDPKAKVAYRLRVSGTTPPTAGEVRGVVKVRTTDPEQAEITIPLTSLFLAPQNAPAVKTLPGQK
ncbi:MAG: DUF1573 domain-containing protein [Phycisphaerae bacterium]|nr:DUF1573 domain-containing protein [Phycisphaerae bacterium]